MVKFSWFPFRIFLDGLLFTKKQNPTNQWTKPKNPNHKGGLLDVVSDLKNMLKIKEFVMPTTIKQQKKKINYRSRTG